MERGTDACECGQPARNGAQCSVLRIQCDGRGTSGSMPLAPRSVLSRRSGYILLELVIALTIFSIAVLGLSQSLTQALAAANTMNKEHAIRIGLKSFLEEARKKTTTSEMAMTTQDDRLGVTYTSTIDDAGLTNKDGKTLSNLYKLTAKATITGVAEDQQPEPVTVYVYQTQSGK